MQKLQPNFAVIAGSVALRETNLRLSDADRSVRAASFAASACLIALACLVLLITSRVRLLYEPPAIQGVSVKIETRAPPHPARARSAGVARIDARAQPTPTLLPMARDALSRLQACSSPNPQDRPADCARLAQAPDWRGSEELPIGGAFNRAPPPNLDQAFTRGELMARAVPPPCRLGLHAFVLGLTPVVQYCAHTYSDPPAPARDPAEICDAAGIGPCHPPPFRSQDVVLLAHTQ